MLKAIEYQVALDGAGILRRVADAIDDGTYGQVLGLKIRMIEWDNRPAFRLTLDVEDGEPDPPQEEVDDVFTP